MSKEMYIYLTIEKFEEDPDDVISMIGVKPSSVQRIGDSIGKSKLRCKWNAIKYQVNAKDKFDLENLVDLLFNKFKNKTHLKKAIDLGQSELVCVFYSADRTPCISLNSRQINMLSKLNCKFSLDYYFTDL